VIGLVLLIGAIIVAAGGSFTLLAGHTKSGVGLIVLGVIAVAASIYTFFSRSTTEKVQLDREWM
jgi:uncharacterized membrane protein YfcA